MSLTRQVWIAVILTAFLAFSGSILIGVSSAQNYFSRQLSKKNEDIANALALSITQIDKERNLIDLQVAQLFDTGDYQVIYVKDSLGRIISQRKREQTNGNVPEWFIRLLKIESAPGQAEIGSGWRKHGSVTVISQNHFAYQMLWEQMLKMLFWIGLLGIASGILAMIALRSISRSLFMIVNQAKAIGERRLITISEPRLPEFKVLAQAMNTMVERIWRLFNEETARIDELRLRVNYDQLTGLPNREYFIAHIRAHLTGVESAQRGAIILVRLIDLNQLNSELGRAETDSLLREIGKIAAEITATCEDAISGRIKAGEIAIMIPGECNTEKLADNLAVQLDAVMNAKWSRLQDIFHIGAVSFDRSANLADILSRVDHALAKAEQEGPNSSYALSLESQLNVMPSEQWHAQISHAIDGRKFSLDYFPVLNIHGNVLHQEAMVRMQISEDVPLVEAGEFMPFASHFNLTSLIDLDVIRLATQQLEKGADPVAVNISAASISNWTFRSELGKLLRGSPDICSRLWIEVTEYGAFRNFDAFKDVCITLKGMGCHVGVEQFGQRLSEIRKVTELGLDYVKLHSSLVEGIELSDGNQEFIRRFCEVVHTVGVQVIATGVQKESDWEAMRKLGVDGVTGPVVVSITHS